MEERCRLSLATRGGDHAHREQVTIGDVEKGDWLRIVRKCGGIEVILLVWDLLAELHMISDCTSNK
jgi:hypothetical protein